MKNFALALTLFLILLPVSYQNGTAQNNIPEGTEKIIIDGKEYYLHKVRKSEGIYRISVSYGVSQKELLEVNPSIAFGLKVGQIVKVPVIKGRNSTEEQLNSEAFIYHTVEKGQTAYYIAKRYRVELKDIYDNNPGSDQQLLLGTIIKIPKKNVPESEFKVDDEGYTVHKVKPKETLYGIARKYNLHINDIIRHNEGLESGVLAKGSLIRIPVKVEDKIQEPEKVEVAGNEDENYLYHRISAGETLFSIAEKYNTKTSDVLAVNQSINANDLPLGYLVRIPKNAIKAKPQSSFANAVLIDHKIKKRETLSMVAKRYDVPAEMIEKVNAEKGIDLERWKKGMVIKVPNKAWLEQYFESILVQADKTVDADTSLVLSFEQRECEEYDYSLLKPSIKVALLMPFNVEATKKVNYSYEEVEGDTILVENETRKLSIRSKVFVEFYQGSLLALEALKKEGVNVDLFVYDTAPDSIKLKEILNKPELRHVDLIIGPAYSYNLKFVSDFSKQHSIPMVYPLSPVNSEMNNNPLLFQANPTDTLMFDVMAKRMIAESMGKRLVMIRTENMDNLFEQRFSRVIRDKVYWESFKNGEMPDFVEYTFKQDDLVSLERMFAVDKGNAVIIPSVEEAQVNRIITTVKGAADKTKADVTLWGLPEWMKYNTINPEDVHKLNGHMFSYYAVDYADSTKTQRIDDYRLWFGTEPIAISPFFQAASVNANLSRYSLWGHDLTYYFISAIRDFGQNFTHCIQHHHPYAIQSKLSFRRLSGWGGFHNQGLYVLNFKPDYELEIKTVE
jgi:LysM repeat protein